MLAQLRLEVPRAQVAAHRTAPWFFSLERWAAEDSSGDFQAHLGGQLFNGFNVIHVLVIHKKAQGVAASTAAKAVIKLLVRFDAKRRGFLLVKRAQALVVLEGFFQCRIGIDHVDDVDAG